MDGGEFYCRAKTKLNCGHTVEEVYTAKSEEDAKSGATRLVSHRANEHMKTCNK